MAAQRFQGAYLQREGQGDAFLNRPVKGVWKGPDYSDVILRQQAIDAAKERAKAKGAVDQWKVDDVQNKPHLEYEQVDRLLKDLPLTYKLKGTEEDRANAEIIKRDINMAKGFIDKRTKENEALSTFPSKLSAENFDIERTAKVVEREKKIKMANAENIYKDDALVYSKEIAKQDGLNPDEITKPTIAGYVVASVQANEPNLNPEKLAVPKPVDFGMMWGRQLAANANQKGFETEYRADGSIKSVTTKTEEGNSVVKALRSQIKNSTDPRVKQTLKDQWAISIGMNPSDLDGTDVSEMSEATQKEYKAFVNDYVDKNTPVNTQETITTKNKPGAGSGKNAPFEVTVTESENGQIPKGANATTGETEYRFGKKVSFDLSRPINLGAIELGKGAFDTVGNEVKTGGMVDANIYSVEVFQDGIGKENKTSVYAVASKNKQGNEGSLTGNQIMEQSSAVTAKRDAQAKSVKDLESIAEAAKRGEAYVVIDGKKIPIDGTKYTEYNNQFKAANEELNKLDKEVKSFDQYYFIKLYEVEEDSVGNLKPLYSGGSIGGRMKAVMESKEKGSYEKLIFNPSWEKAKKLYIGKKANNSTQTKTTNPF